MSELDPKNGECIHSRPSLFLDDTQNNNVSPPTILGNERVTEESSGLLEDSKGLSSHYNKNFSNTELFGFATVSSNNFAQVSLFYETYLLVNVFSFTLIVAGFVCF